MNWYEFLLIGLVVGLALWLLPRVIYFWLVCGICAFIVVAHVAVGTSLSDAAFANVLFITYGLSVVAIYELASPGARTRVLRRVWGREDPYL